MRGALIEVASAEGTTPITLPGDSAADISTDQRLRTLMLSGTNCAGAAINMGSPPPLAGASAVAMAAMSATMASNRAAALEGGSGATPWRMPAGFTPGTAAAAESIAASNTGAALSINI